jgi:hypothetical protein
MTAQYYYTFYLNQARGSRVQIGAGVDNYNLYYRGVRFQRPHVGRGWFSNLFSRVLPVLKSIGKSAGKSVLKGVLDVGEDLLEGRKLSESVRDRAQQRGKEIASSSIQTVREQVGSGPIYNLAIAKKRKRASSIVKAPRKSPKKRITDKLHVHFLNELKKYKKKGQNLKRKKTTAAATKRPKRKQKKKPTKQKSKKTGRLLQGLTK